jgi:hypothetical protein
LAPPPTDHTSANNALAIASTSSSFIQSAEGAYWNRSGSTGYE